MNNIDAAKQEVENLTLEYAELKLKLSSLKIQVNETEARLHEIHGGFSRTGLLADAKLNLESAERVVRDSTRRLVVWEVSPFIGGWYQSPEPYIIDKITPKRIYVRQRGEKQADYYDKDGTNGYGNCKIDIIKTFPEGLDEYTKANK